MARMWPGWRAWTAEAKKAIERGGPGAKAGLVPTPSLGNYEDLEVHAPERKPANPSPEDVRPA